MAAGDGDAMAKTELGVLYVEGIGVNEDIATAYKLWSESARQGYAPAQFNLALVYARGYGIEQNIEIAHMWLLLSAGGGYADAEAALDQLTAVMSQQQIRNSVDRARVCNISDYKNCD